MTLLSLYRRAGWSQEKLACALRSAGRLARDRAARDVLDSAAANTDIAQLVVRELRQFAHCLAMSAPSLQLLRNRLEGDHFLVPLRFWQTVRLLHCDMMTSHRKQ